MKTKILEHVRNVCGLKKLEFGARFEFFNSLPTYGDKICLKYNSSNSDMRYLNVDTGKVTYCVGGIGDFEIIGLPVQLNDLLFAIFLMLQYSSSWENHKKILSDLFIPTYDAGVYKNKQLYDLQKTVEQNLEDEALCKLLVEVLNIK